MKKLKNKLMTNIIAGIILPILLVVGIVMIILYAKNNTILLVLGIVFVIMGFYGSPMVWVTYGSKKQDLRLLSLIYNENIYSIDSLAEQLGMEKQTALNEVRKLINQGYLTGYLLKDNNYLELNTNEKQGKKVTIVKCPSCGAKNRVIGNSCFCEYCGEKLENINK